MTMEKALSKEEILATLRSHKEEIRNRFGIEKMALFGSVARNEATPSSDVDIAIIKMRKKSYWTLLDFMEYVGELLGKRVDAGFYEGMRPTIKQFVEKDLVNV
ncbi:nucleotidyltransferase family protein [Hydrogenimonas sp.]